MRKYHFSNLSFSVALAASVRHFCLSIFHGIHIVDMANKASAIMMRTPMDLLIVRLNFKQTAVEL